MTYAPFPFDGKMPAPPPGERNHDLIDVERLLRMAARQFRVVAACCLIGLFLGVVYLQTTPLTYTATARVLIDEGLSRITEDTASPLSMQTDGAVLSQIEILTSARLAGNVVDKMGLTENPAFMEPPSSLFGAAVGRLRGVVGWLRSGQAAPDAGDDPAGLAARQAQAKRRHAVDQLQKNVIAQRIGRTFVILVGYQSHDPQLAADITNAYVEAYLSHQLEASYEASERATVWLEDRLEDLRVSSQNAARQVEEYRAEHGLAESEGGRLLTERQLGELTAQLIEAQAATAQAGALYQQYRAIVESGSAEAAGNAAITSGQPPTSEIVTLKTQYNNVTRREREVTANFGEDHPQAAALRREQGELIRSIFAELQQMTESYRNDYEVARAREAGLRETIAEARGESAEANRSNVVLRELEQQATALSSLYQTFLSRYEETQQSQTFPIAKVRSISDASAPRDATGPRTSVVLGISLILGGMLGCAFGALNEFNERFFRTGEDVNEHLGMKFLGYLPAIARSEAKGKPAGLPPKAPATGAARPANGLAERRARMRMTLDAPGSMFAETLRNAKIAADIVLQENRSKVVGVMSILPREGKSTVAANLGYLLASNGAKTLLIDADLRNPGLTRTLGIRSEGGLIEAAVSPQSWRSFLKHDRQTGLAILPAVVRGRFSHTSELLSSPGMRQLLKQARENFDHVIVDLPPLAPVVDAKAFEPLADAFVMVVEWGRTPRAMVRSTLASEPRIAGKILGVMLNGVNLASLPKYGAFGSSEQFLRSYSSYYLDRNETRDKEPA